MLLPEDTANPYSVPATANKEIPNARPKLTTSQSLRRSFSKRFGWGSTTPVYGNQAPAKSQDQAPKVEERPAPRPVQLEDAPSPAVNDYLGVEAIPARPSSRSSLRRTLSKRLGSSRPSSMHIRSETPRSETPTPQVRVELVDLPPRPAPTTQPSPSPSALARHRRSGSADGNSSLQPANKKQFRWSTGALPTLNSLPTVPEDGGKEVRFDLDAIAKQAEAGTGLHRSGTVPPNLGRSASVRNMFRSRSTATPGHRPSRSMSSPQKMKPKPIVEEDDDDEDYDDYSHRQEFNYSMGMYDYSDYGRMDY